ncbi:hypothetical protein PS2_036293 [Malus domestica]
MAILPSRVSLLFLLWHLTSLPPVHFTPSRQLIHSQLVPPKPNLQPEPSFLPTISVVLQILEPLTGKVWKLEDFESHPAFCIGITFSALWQPINALQGVGKGNVSEITFSNINMSTRYYDRSWWGRAEPIYATTCPRHSKSNEGSISNLLFVNITSTSENGVFLSGSKGGLLSDLRFINLDLTYRRWTNNAGGLVDYRPGCQGLVKHSTAGIIMEHINGWVIDNVNMRWSDDPLRQWNDPLDFRSATVNNICLLNFHSSLYKQ